jgi:hypothetical protein
LISGLTGERGDDRNGVAPATDRHATQHHRECGAERARTSDPPGWIGNHRFAPFRSIHDEEDPVPAHKTLLVCLIGLIAAVPLAAGCGDDDSADDESNGTAEATVAGQATTEQADPLVGEWVTENACDEFVAALEDAGLEEFAAEMAPGVAKLPAGKVDQADPCAGAEPVDHSHSFSEDGAFASFDDKGRQVDEGTYALGGDGRLTVSRPPDEVTVDYRVRGDEATFDVVVPENCDSKQCRFETALGIATFFPRTYERVR